MILIAPDKFKGTLTAAEATETIAQAIGHLPHIKAPMADGGEGTASILCRDLSWDKHDCYYVHRPSRTAVIDSSAVIGLQQLDLAHHDILRASSAPLGVKVREILKGGCERVIIGIGGTATCDGGMGFIEALGIEKVKSYRSSLIGLSDVRVPLVAEGDLPSALTFAPQKGASQLDIQVLRRRLEHLYEQYPLCRSPFDGAGGGLGFAIASLIGAQCFDGAKYMIDSYDIDWSRISLVITGEGSIDSQSRLGKVVGTLTRIAQERGIPLLAFGGKVDPEIQSPNIISLSNYYPELPLNRDTAILRLKAAVNDILPAII